MEKLLMKDAQPYLEQGFELYKGVQLKEAENGMFIVVYWYKFDKNGHETFQDFDQALSRYNYYKEDILG